MHLQLSVYCIFLFEITWHLQCLCCRYLKVIIYRYVFIRVCVNWYKYDTFWDTMYTVYVFKAKFWFIRSNIGWSSMYVTVAIHSYLKFQGHNLFIMMLHRTLLMFSKQLLHIKGKCLTNCVQAYPHILKKHLWVELYCRRGPFFVSVHVYLSLILINPMTLCCLQCLFWSTLRWVTHFVFRYKRMDYDKI